MRGHRLAPVKDVPASLAGFSRDGRRLDPEVPLGSLPLTWAFVVVGTGVDPVTFRFSGGRSSN
jgi:hypothetical protein